MLRFSVGKIPVEVRTSHIFFSFVLAFLFSHNAPVPPPVAIACWVLVISLSVLVHELGHALAGLSFGHQPSIVLVAMGGYTLTSADKPLPWLKDIAFTLAGPLAGYFLAGLFGLATFLVPNDNFPALHYVCFCFVWANVVWSTFNLLPLGPLDGGRIATILCTRLSPKRGLLYAQVLGLVCGAPILAWALLSKNLFMALFVGMFVLRSFWLMVELLRKEAPPALALAPAPSSEEELARIKALLEEGSYAEGLQQAENLLAGALPPEESARAHYLAGWLAIKSNQGRKALNHFSQTENIQVPPQAMAAAFSLLGEDARALPLWEMAALQSENPTLLHEWAGTLLRLGRDAEVRDMAGIRLAKAYLCAESVFRLRREYVQAAQAGEASFLLEPEAEVAYEAACNYALAKDDNNALRMLALAAQNGFREPQKALADPSLLHLRCRPEFQEWIGTLQ
jgi:Zn-dependent protease